MATIELNYGTSNQTITITLTSLASSQTVGRASTVVSNTTALSLDALISGKVKTVAGTPANDKCLYVFAYGSSDGGTTYTEGATGSDAGFTRIDPTNLKPIGVINVPAGATSYQFGPFPVAIAFGGLLPEKWGIVVINYTGLALSGTASDMAFFYQLLEGQSV